MSCWRRTSCRESASQEECAVLGGGLVGLETAVHMGWLGRKVTIFEKVDTLCPDVVSGVLPALLKLVDDNGIAKVLNATVVEILLRRSW